VSVGQKAITLKPNNMKRFLILFFSLVIFIGCTNREHTHKYQSFGNAWEHDNLFGKVKTLEEFRANVINFNTNQTEESIIQFRKKYSETGQLIYHETFSNFGELEQRLQNEFDSSGNRVKTNLENFLFPFKSTETAVYDDEGRLVFTSGTFDDTLHVSAVYKYDHLNNLFTQKSIQNSDTSSVFFEYKYNVQDQIVWRKQIDVSNEGVYEFITEFLYDNAGNNIELFNTSEILGELKIQHEYNAENKLIRTTEFQDGYKSRETTFDIHQNPILVKHFYSSEFVSELKHDYSFDRTGNWIERRTFLNENDGDKRAFKLIFFETRKIEYY
jgi:hypothetical protein